ncbi:AAA family ATPase [Dyadobacter sp. CY356]|uniref:AAA family ATPase n=1 Tax=Dyadobacter sp. CY356 TaxID=2906442 RepID=UPI001F2C71FC|nr:AAA family ATPase [Dyadobacter sp. CY356]MCF0056682.1 AAA family ATPase [Dyadobacter sp. CY356]
MEIEIRNFGPLDTLKFDLEKDLHLIYGQNAIGKSYATYCLYCLIKNITNKSISGNYNYLYLERSEDSAFDNFINTNVKSLKSSKSVDCTKDFSQLIDDALKKVVLQGLQNSLLNTFSSLKNLKNRYSNKNYEIIISISEVEKLTICSDDEGVLDLSYVGTFDKVEIIQKATKSTKFSLIVNGFKAIGKPTEIEFANEFKGYIFSKVNEILRKLDFNIRDIYYLPASRSGLYQALNAFTPIIAELTQNRFFIQNKSIELPSLSEPLADYFIDLSTVNKKNINKEFEDIINLLQNDILRGEVVYNDKTRRILYKPKGIELELNLSEASSMVAELSPLVLYFKHILNNKYSSAKNRDPFFYDEFYYRLKRRTKDRGYDILFIEEPEAHLHPEVQVKLMEIFAKLSTLKLKVFITSHSNYMFNKLNNLLIKGEIDNQKIKVYHLVTCDEGTTINSDMKVSENGINDENFQDVSEQLYYERFNFLEENND